MGRDYFQTKDGILNLVLLVLNTVSFVCMVSSVTTGVGNAFMVATILGFSITGAFCLAHFLGFTAKIPWPWSYMEIIYTEIWMLYYFIVTGFILTTGIIQYIAAGIKLDAQATFLHSHRSNFVLLFSVLLGIASGAIALIGGFRM